MRQAYRQSVIELNFGLFRNFQGAVDLDAKVLHCGLEPPMT